MPSIVMPSSFLWFHSCMETGYNRNLEVLWTHSPGPTNQSQILKVAAPKLCYYFKAPIKTETMARLLRQ